MKIRLYPVIDDSDDIQQLGAVPNTDAVNACGAAISGTFLVRRNMRAGSEPKREVYVGTRRHRRVQSLNH